MAELKKQTQFKLNKRGSVHFEENTAPVNIAYAKEVNDVAILPQGAIEQHGPHCPNRLDSFNAIHLAEKVAERCSAFIKDLLEKHPVSVNTLGFRNPLGFNGFNGGSFVFDDKDHNEKGRPAYYKK